MSEEMLANVRATAVEHDPFAGEAIARAVPTTEPQREVWLADQLGRDASLAYNESISLTMRGALDAAALERSLEALLDRHEALRATVSDNGMQLVMAARGTTVLARADLAGVAPEARAEALAQLRVLAVEMPFDLAAGPLLRATLVRLGTAEHELVLTAHHIVCDGWSFGVIATELMALYAAGGRPAEAGLPPAVPFGDYALAQQTPEHRQAAEADARWWMDQYAGGIPVLELPTDHPRRGQRTFRSRRVDLEIDAGLAQDVRKMGARKGASLFATLFTAYGALLARLAGQDEVVVGVPAAGQAAEGAASLVGHCVQLLPIRMQAEVDVAFPELLEAARGAVLDGYDHQSCTYGTLLQRLVVARDPSRLPLVSVLFNLDSAIDGASLSRGGLEVGLRSNPRHFENFDLFLNASQVDGGIVLECQYNLDLFDGDTIHRWLALYRDGLARLVAQPRLSPAEAYAPTAADLALLDRFNRSAAEYPRERIETQVARRAAAAPDAPAVVAQAGTLTYAELERRSNALAHALRGRGVGPGQFVGLYCGRNAHMFVALLGILKSGAGYIPMDPAFPADRLDFMSTDAGARFIVTDRSVPGEWKFRTAEPIVLDELGESAEPAPPAGSVDDPAFVIYTSGSTGKPKGVRIAHRSMANLLESVRREPGMRAQDTVLAVTTLSFDIATSEVICPLTVGARIVLADRAQATDGDRLRELVEANGVDFIDATPSTWRLLISAGWRGGRHVKAICTGEPLPPDLGRELLERVGELWNGYGPTETTVWSSFHRVLAIEGVVPIGHPVANTQIHVVDAQLRRMPVGAAGEIFIAGDGVTLGYLGRPELTAEKFRADPYAATPGGRGYLTGDLGRWRADGVLECLGRRDSQVKLRGYRIELGEIEATLANHPGVDRSVVVKREDRLGDPRLVAYCVAKGAPLAEGEVRDFLRHTLPEYMIPQHVVALAKLPLLPNGKLDRKSLPAPESTASRSMEFVAPATELEKAVVARMEEVLALPGIGMADNFFALGGHSLLAAQLAAQLGRALGERLPLRAVFEAPTPRELVAWIEAGRKAGASGREAIPRRAERQTAPVSLMQHRVWFLDQLEPGRPTYNTPSAHRLRGAFDAEAFARAFAEVVRRQDSLRTSIEVVDNAPVQVIHPEIAVDLLPVEDLRNVPEARREADLMARLEALAAEPFDLAVAPLFRARLFRTADDEHVFYFGPHHIVWDGWSFDLLYHEMSALYSAYRNGTTPSLPDLPVAYGDFAAWHREWMQGAELAAEVSHWKERLGGTLPTLEIPGDRPRPPEMSGEGGSLWVHLDPAQVEAARALGREHDATLFMVMLAAYALTLHQLTGQRELVVGVPVRGRQVAELEPVMGFFVNALPLRLRIDPQASFAQLVADVRNVALDAFRHPDVPFEQLVRELNVPRDRSRFPIYQALFSFQDARARETHWGDLEHDMIHVMQPGIAEDLSLWLMDRPAGIVGGLAWNADILERASAERVRARFTHAVAFALAHAREPLAKLGLPRAESDLLARWNDTRRAIDGPATVHAMVSAQAARTPQRIALSAGSTRLTYAELDGRANALARELRARGARRGERVGLFVERGADMVAAMLAVLKTGAAYVPLDPNFPRERLAFMAADAALVAVVADSAAAPPPDVAPDRVVALDALREALTRGAPALEADAAGPADCAYVIYTSGTTGKPKGVQVPHRAVVNFLASMRAEPGLGADDRLVAVTTLSFDIAVLELLLPLTTGAETVIASRDDALDPRALAGLLQSSRATVMQATPGTWRMLLDSGWAPAPGFRALIGGEPLPPDLAGRLVAVVGELWNMYGPTETTVWSTCARVREAGAAITIGGPIANTQVRILDEHGRETPIGVPGEIWIGGSGVALGYLNRPDLAAEKFVADERSSEPGARIYRTGDRGRWRADGTVEHLGRNDFQVKVRGFRIELGEIEARLAEHPGVAQAAVLAREDTPGDVRLVAYFVPRAVAPEAAALREHLRAFLPAYMVPQHTVALAAIPLLPNGKVDRSALPAPEPAAPVAAPASASLPSTESEQQLAEIWSALLRVPGIRVDDNFFDLGGHSLLAMQAMLQMEERTGRQIQRSRLIFETLGQIARAYDEAPVAAPRKRSGLKGMLSGLLGR